MNNLPPCKLCGCQPNMIVNLGKRIVSHPSVPGSKRCELKGHSYGEDVWRLLMDTSEVNYQAAKKAVELFESEYIGQNQGELWSSCVNEAHTYIEGKSDG